MLRGTQRRTGSSWWSVGLRAVTGVAIAFGATITVAAPAHAAEPGIPTNLTVTAGPGVGQMTLRWRCQCPTAAYRSPDMSTEPRSTAACPARPHRRDPARRVGRSCRVRRRRSSATDARSAFAAEQGTPGPTAQRSRPSGARRTKRGLSLALPARLGIRDVVVYAAQETGGLPVSYEYAVATTGAFGPMTAIPPAA